MTHEHQLDEDKFRTMLPEDIRSEPFPAFPTGVRLAVMVGHPAEPGPYLIRVKVPGGTKLMPHKHPEDRIYTVMSGVFYIGLGEAFDGNRLRAYPPGSVIVLPGETWHFHWAKSASCWYPQQSMTKTGSNSIRYAARRLSARGTSLRCCAASARQATAFRPALFSPLAEDLNPHAEHLALALHCLRADFAVRKSPLSKCKNRTRYRATHCHEDLSDPKASRFLPARHAF